MDRYLWGLENIFWEGVKYVLIGTVMGVFCVYGVLVILDRIIVWLKKRKK